MSILAPVIKQGYGAEAFWARAMCLPPHLSVLWMVSCRKESSLLQPFMARRPYGGEDASMLNGMETSDGGTRPQTFRPSCCLRTAFVEPGASQLAHGPNRARLAQAIRHPLRNPSRHAKLVGQLSGVEWLRQRGGQHSAQIGGRAKGMLAQHLDEQLVLDLVIVVPPPSSPSVSRVTPFLDFYEQDFECQPAMGKNAREVDKLLKYIEQHTSLRATTARDNAPAGTAKLHEVFLRNDRLHDRDTMRLQKGSDLVANGRQRG
jgi:hypothetical protein